MYEVETLAEFGNRIKHVEDLERQVALLTEQNKKLEADVTKAKHSHYYYKKKCNNLTCQLSDYRPLTRAEKAIVMIENEKHLTIKQIADKAFLSVSYVQNLSCSVKRGLLHG
tara:strand:+ start:319 stop:654 length:336 start_codon:yes stop_codon:yes gene_type:complete